MTDNINALRARISELEALIFSSWAPISQFGTISLPRSVVGQALYHLNRGDADAVCWADGVIKPALEQPTVKPGGIQPNWMPVPVEPTEAMLDAGCEAVDGPDWTGPNAVYRAMLAAAPQPPTTEQSSVVELQGKHQPVAEVIESHVRAGLDGRFTAEVAGLERLSVGAELFTHPQNLRCKSTQDRLATLWGYVQAEPPKVEQETSPTAGMNIAQRILHVGGRNNAAGYVEFGSIQAVEALVRQVLRDLPQKQREPLTREKIRAIQHELSDTVGCSYETMARAIERDHGIDQKPTAPQPPKGEPAPGVGRDDIIRMAREAGIGAAITSEDGLPKVWGMPTALELERFAAPVEAATLQACMDIVARHRGSAEIEVAIRARGQA